MVADIFFYAERLSSTPRHQLWCDNSWIIVILTDGIQYSNDNRGHYGHPEMLQTTLSRAQACFLKYNEKDVVTYRVTKIHRREEMDFRHIFLLLWVKSNMVTKIHRSEEMDFRNIFQLMWIKSYMVTKIHRSPYICNQKSGVLPLSYQPF